MIAHIAHASAQSCRYARFLLLVSVCMLSCGREPVRTSPEMPRTASSVLAHLEQRLTSAKTLRVSLRLSDKGTPGIVFSGTLVLKSPNLANFTTTDPAISRVSDGRTLELGALGTVRVPQDLNRLICIGLARVGVYPTLFAALSLVDDEKLCRDFPRLHELTPVTDVSFGDPQGQLMSIRYRVSNGVGKHELLDVVLQYDPKSMVIVSREIRSGTGAALRSEQFQEWVSRAELVERNRGGINVTLPAPPNPSRT